MTSLVLVAAAAVLVIWDYDVTAPWTRGCRVRVQVAGIAPLVSGQIIELRVVDNQFVHKGDELSLIEPFDESVSLNSAEEDRTSRIGPK